VLDCLPGLMRKRPGNRVKREFVDSETGDPVERDEQVKGYEIENLPVLRFSVLKAMRSDEEAAV
jgi:non-homologous end joining protein Ku